MNLLMLSYDTYLVPILMYLFYVIHWRRWSQGNERSFSPQHSRLFLIACETYWLTTWSGVYDRMLEAKKITEWQGGNWVDQINVEWLLNGLVVWNFYNRSVIALWRHWIPFYSLEMHTTSSRCAHVHWQKWAFWMNGFLMVFRLDTFITHFGASQDITYQAGKHKLKQFSSYKRKPLGHFFGTPCMIERCLNSSFWSNNSDNELTRTLISTRKSWNSAHSINHNRH